MSKIKIVEKSRDNLYILYNKDDCIDIEKEIGNSKMIITGTHRYKDGKTAFIVKPNISLMTLEEKIDLFLLINSF